MQMALEADLCRHADERYLSGSKTSEAATLQGRQDNGANSGAGLGVLVICITLQEADPQSFNRLTPCPVAWHETVHWQCMLTNQPRAGKLQDFQLRKQSPGGRQCTYHVSGAEVSEFNGRSRQEVGFTVTHGKNSVSGTARAWHGMGISLPLRLGLERRFTEVRAAIRGAQIPGKVPVRLLRLRSRFCRDSLRGPSTQCSGTDPESWLEAKFRVCRDGQALNSVGTPPVSWLPSADRKDMDTQPWARCAKLPPMSLWLASKCTRFPSLDQEVGTIPLISFELMSILRRRVF